MLNINEFKKEIGVCQILDTRSVENFKNGFIEGSINIPLNSQFAIWAGTVLDLVKPVILITEQGKE